MAGERILYRQADGATSRCGQIQAPRSARRTRRQDGHRWKHGQTGPHETFSQACVSGQKRVPIWVFREARLIGGALFWPAELDTLQPTSDLCAVPAQLGHIIEWISVVEFAQDRRWQLYLSGVMQAWPKAHVTRAFRVARRLASILRWNPARALGLMRVSHHSSRA